MKEKTCCFTGHRNISPAKFIYIKHRLITVIEEAISSGITDFCTGGALGFDTVAAQTVLEAKKNHPHIKLHLVLPCKGQAENWSVVNRRIYEDILGRADSVTYVSENYTRYCMQLRNREMVDRSSICISYLEKNTGGTAYTVKYAESKGLKIISIIE
ncbi:MAG: SLOG family protein [Acutalibacteraceae bacterium]|nr:SLOG family protein [Acutalibacteraceae bacterium]